MNTAIDVKQLSVTLGNRHILHDINVSVPIGKITTLIGPNGCGKSTLCMAMVWGRCQKFYGGRLEGMVIRRW